MGKANIKMGVKERYLELSKKYRLPSFDEIDNEFEISTIEKEHFLLREIRRKITEKIEVYAKILEEILHPDPPTVSNMYESGVFDEKSRDEIFVLFKKLMYLNRLSVEASIDENEQKSSDYINAVFKNWKDIKKEFLRHIKNAKESWLRDIDIKEKLGYLG